MLRSLLLLSLFVGLISMLVPDDRKGQTVRFLMIVIMLLSFVGGMLNFSVKIPWMEVVEEDVPADVPLRAALHNAVKSRVHSFTGSYPISVESDFSIEGEGCVLSVIRVVIVTGNVEEVADDLKKAFSFDGFDVRKEAVSGSAENNLAFSEIPRGDFRLDPGGGLFDAVKFRRGRKCGKP